MSHMLTILAVCYPLVSWLSIYLAKVEWAAGYLAILFLLMWLVSLRSRGMTISNVLVGLCFVAALILGLQAKQLVQLFPLMMYGGLLFLFVSSLLPGQTPLITRFAIVMNDKPVPPIVLRYGRWVTMAWSIFFLIMLLVSLSLERYASFSAWSSFTNFYSYLLIGFMFVLEFYIRRRVMRGRGHKINYPFTQFIRRLTRIKLRDLTFGWRA